MKIKRTRKHILQNPQLSLFSDLNEVIPEAIQFIQENEPEDGYHLCFSGGKDSIVLYELVRISGVKYIPIYSATGIDPPEIVSFIKRNYPEVLIAKPKESFYTLLYRKDLPTHQKRWCCVDLKHRPPKQITTCNNKLVGVRQEEGHKRAKRARIEYNTKDKEYIYKPIFYWSEYHVWGFIEQFNLKYPSLYDEGFSRIGCVVCPFICLENLKQIKINKQRWPGIYSAFERSVEKWFYQVHVYIRDKKFKNETFEEYLLNWYKGRVQ